MAPSNGVVGWSAVCDCGISQSYSLAFLNIKVFSLTSVD